MSSTSNNDDLLSSTSYPSSVYFDSPSTSSSSSSFTPSPSSTNLPYYTPTIVPSSTNTTRSTTVTSPLSLPIQPIKKKDSVGIKGSKLKTSTVRIVLDGMKLDDPGYMFDQIMLMLQKDHAELVDLFDMFHEFVNLVGGMSGKPTDSLWAKNTLTGKKHLVQLVKDALQETLSSISISEVPSLPFTKETLARSIPDFPVDYQDQPFIKSEPTSYDDDIGNGVEGILSDVGRARLQAIDNFIQEVNAINKTFRLVLHRKDVNKDGWLEYDRIPFVDAAWQNIHLVDLKHPIIRYPTELSVIQWIDKVSVDKDVSEIRKLLEKHPSSADNVQRALLKATDAKFAASYTIAMKFARRKYPGISVFDPRFQTMLKDEVEFAILVSDLFNNTNTAPKTYASVKSIIAREAGCNISIANFMRSKPASSQHYRYTSVPISLSSSQSYASSPFSMFQQPNNNYVLTSQPTRASDFLPNPKTITDFLIP